MAGPGGRSVDRISIRVLPDTSAFGRSLERYLQRIEKRLRVQIPTEIDVKGIETDLERVKGRVKAQPAQLRVQADTDEFTRRVKLDVQRVERQIEARIPVTAKGEQLRRDLAVKVAAIQAEIDRFGVEVPLSTKDAARARAELLAQIRVLQKAANARKIELTVDLDRTLQSRLRAVGSAFRGAAGQAAELTRIVGRLGVATAAVGVNVLKWAAPIAAAASVAVTAAPFIIAAGEGVAKYGKAAIAASPALLAFAAAGTLVYQSLKLITPGLGKALKPIGKAFEKVGESASAAATKGIQPFVDKFTKLAVPTLAPGIHRIATAVNGVVKSFLAWGASTKGLATLKKISGETAQAFEKIAPAVGRFSTSLLEMIGRISGITLGRGSTALTTFLDKLREKMNAVDATTIRKAFDTLKEGADKARDALQKVHDKLAAGVAFYKKYETQIKLAADAMAVLAIAFGGPAVALAAAGSLIVRHFGSIRNAITNLNNAVSGNSNLGQFFATASALGREFVQVAQDLWAEAKQKLAPAFEDAGRALRDELLPQVTQFLQNVGPGLIFTIRTAGSVLIAFTQLLVHQFTNMVTVISGSLEAINGVLERNPRKIQAGLNKMFEGTKKYAADTALDIGRLFSEGLEAGALAGLGDARRAGITLQQALAAGLRTGDLTPDGRRIARGFEKGFGGEIPVIEATARKIPGNVKGAIVQGGGIGVLLPVGKQTGQGMATGLTQSFPGVKTAGAGLPKATKAGVGPTASLLTPAGKQAAAGMTAGVSSGAKGVKTAGAALPKSVTSGVGDTQSLLKDAGRNVGAGFADGISASVARVQAAARSLAASVPQSVSGLMRMKSPSRVMIQLGRYVGEGFAKGITGTRDQVKTAIGTLVTKIRDAVTSFKSQKNTISDRIDADRKRLEQARERYAAALRRAANGSKASLTSYRQAITNAALKLAKDKRAKKALEDSFAGIAAGVGPEVIAEIKKGQSKLLILAKAREQTAEALAAAQDKLQDAIKVRDDYAASIRDAAVAFGSLVGAEAAEGKALTASDVVKNLQTKLQAILKFRANLDKLRTSGLSDAALKQLTDAGVEAGGATADALAAGGAAVISEVNGLIGSIGDQAQNMGTQAGQRFYQAGVDSAQGLVNGLLSQAEFLKQAVEKLVDDMVAVIRRKLKIKSPSQVAIGLGANFGGAFASGIDSMNSAVGSAADRLAGRVTQPSAFVDPSADDSAQRGSLTVNVTNPVPETASDSVTRIMRSRALRPRAA